MPRVILISSLSVERFSKIHPAALSVSRTRCASLSEPRTCAMRSSGALTAHPPCAGLSAHARRVVARSQVHNCQPAARNDIVTIQTETLPDFINIESFDVMAEGAGFEPAME